MVSLEVFAQREVWNLISLCPHVAETTWADQVPSSSLLKHLAGPHFPVSLSLDWTYDRILASGTGELTIWLLPDQTLEFKPLLSSARKQNCFLSMTASLIRHTEELGPNHCVGQSPYLYPPAVDVRLQVRHTLLLLNHSCSGCFSFSS